MKKNYLLIYSCLCLLVLHVTFVSSQTKVIPYQQLPTATGSLSGSGMYFGATMSPSTITIQFEGPADRWIAFGFGTIMAPADVFMYANGITTSIVPVGWYDYFNNPFTTTIVDIDPIQNWSVTSTATLTNGQRTVTASRALSTGDVNYDIILNYTSTALSLIWARGASADYTIAYHGSSNRADAISLPWLSNPVASFSVPSTTVCLGSSVTFTNLSTGGQTAYNWTFASGNPAVSTATNPSVTYTTPGTYSVALIATNALGSDTLKQVNYITVSPTVATGISIALAGGTNPICGGVLATFTAASVNGGTSPTYQWKVNGSNAGSSGPTFTTNSISGTATITCVMSSNSICPVPASATSAPVTMTVNPSAPATVSVALTGGSNPICNGGLATFSATSGNGGTTPSYQWKINGINTGSNSPSFTINTLSNGDIVTCVLSSNAPCASSTLGTSSGITMTVSSILLPSVAIAIATGSNPLCAGSHLTFTATPTNGGPSPFYQWNVNSVNAGGNNPTFSPGTLANGDVITCFMNSSSPCASPGFANSGALTVTVNPIPPTPTITNSGTHTLCAGSSLTLTSSAPSGNLWSTNSTAQTIVVTSAGNYSVTQTVNNCVSPHSSVITISLVALPATPTISASGDANLCAGESLTLTSSAFSGNLWSTNSTAQSIVVTSSGGYSVTQTGNGCTSLPSNVLTVTVNPLPSATLVPAGPFCTNSPNVHLQGLPPGGFYSGPGVIGNIFQPLKANVGANYILYHYIDTNFCSDTSAISIIVSECLGLDEREQESSSIMVYPNPGPGEFFVYSKIEKINRIRIIDATGKQLISRTICNENKTAFDLRNYASGLYILEIELETQKIRKRLSKTD